MEQGETKLLRNFPKWTETDPQSILSETNDRVTWTDMVKDGTSCRLTLEEAVPLNFTIKMRLRITSIDAVEASPTDYFLGYLWAITENDGRIGYVEVGQQPAIAIMEETTDTTQFYLYLRDTDDVNNDQSVALNVNTDYWIKIVRSGASGQTLNCYIYTETQLADTITITLPAADRITYNYIIVAANIDTIQDGQMDGYINVWTATQGGDGYSVTIGGVLFGHGAGPDSENIGVDPIATSISFVDKHPKDRPTGCNIVLSGYHPEINFGDEIIISKNRVAVWKGLVEEIEVDI